VQIVSCEIQATRVVVKLRSTREPDLAEWAASRVSHVFDEIYGRAVVVSHERT